MARVRATPYVLASAGDAVVVVERAFDDVALLDLRMQVKRQTGPRLPLQQARHLALVAILVQYLDRDPLESGRLPVHILRSDVDRTLGGGVVPEFRRRHVCLRW